MKNIYILISVSIEYWFGRVILVKSLQEIILKIDYSNQFQIPTVLIIIFYHID